MDINAANKVRVKALYDNVLWTHKILEKQADIYITRGIIVKAISIGFVALTSSGVLGAFLTDAAEAKTFSLVVAAIALFVTIFREAQSYEEKSFTCAEAASSFLALRDEVAKCKLAIDGGADYDCTLDHHEREYARLCNSAPRTSNLAKKLAEKAMEDGEFSVVGEVE